MTYAQLIAALQAYVGRSDEGTVANQDNAMMLAAAAIVRQFTPRESMRPVEIDTPGGTGSLPSDFVQAVAVYGADGVYEYIDPREYFGRLANGESMDAMFTVVGESLLVDTDVEGVSMIYSAAPEQISGSQENWLSTRYPDVWLHAAIAEQFRFTQDEEAAADMDGYWQSLAAQALRASTAGAQSGGAIRMRGR